MQMSILIFIEVFRLDYVTYVSHNDMNIIINCAPAEGPDPATQSSMHAHTYIHK